jgi:hypothetical protein
VLSLSKQWYDADGDAYQDVPEPGIGNVTLALYRDTDGNGIFNPITDTLVLSLSKHWWRRPRLVLSLSKQRDRRRLQV